MTEERNAGPWFHARDGFHFRREADGSIGVMVADGNPGELLREIVFDADTWGSVVASVSRRGDNAETFAEARDLHEAA